MEQIIQNRDIILFSFQPWDEEIGCNFKDIALELSANNRVLYVNRALDRFTAFSKRKDPKTQTRLKSIRSGEEELIQVKPNLWVHNPRTYIESINWLPKGFLYNWFSRINSRRLSGEINKIINKLDFNDIILINDNDFFRGIDLKRLIDSEVYIFYIRDFMTFQPWFRKHGPYMEAAMLKEADVVVANSSYLASYGAKFNPRSYDIGQGCDLESFLISDPPLPEDLKKIKHPIIGYTGAISGSRLDKEIISQIAKELPQASIVLIGPVTDAFDATSLKQHENVYFLGKKEPSQMASYVYYFDICINPQQINQLTIGNYPRKADEYLAMGKPVVATKTDAMQLFEGYVFLCETKKDFVLRIKEIFANPELMNGPQETNRRKEFALSHSWKNSLSRLAEILHDYEIAKKYRNVQRQPA